MWIILNYRGDVVGKMEDNYDKLLFFGDIGDDRTIIQSSVIKGGKEGSEITVYWIHNNGLPQYKFNGKLTTTEPWEPWGSIVPTVILD